METMAMTTYNPKTETCYGKNFESELKLYTAIYGNKKDAMQAIRSAENAYFKQAAQLKRRGF
jgi:hypothetical protein